MDGWLVVTGSNWYKQLSSSATTLYTCLDLPWSKFSNLSWHQFKRCSFLLFIQRMWQPTSQTFFSLRCSCNIVFNAVPPIFILSCIIPHVIRPSAFDKFSRSEMVSGSNTFGGHTEWGTSCKLSLSLLNSANRLKTAALNDAALLNASTSC